MNLVVFVGRTIVAGMCFLSLITSTVHAVQTETCGTPSTGMKQPWRVDKAVVYKTQGLAVDADGAPNSYLINGKGLSDTCDGAVGIVNGKPVTPSSDRANWYSVCQNAWSDAVAKDDYTHVKIFGFLKDSKNHPVVQAAGDPFPGTAYISTTTLTVPGTPDRVQRHWVDAVKIPYVVLPTAEFKSKYNSKPGDLAAVYRPKTKSFAFAVAERLLGLGEGSVKLHRDLGNNPMVVRNGVERAKNGIGDMVITVVFPGVEMLRARWTRRSGIRPYAQGAMERSKIGVVNNVLKRALSEYLGKWSQTTHAPQLSLQALSNSRMQSLMVGLHYLKHLH